MADPFDAQGLESQITAALGQMPDPAEQRRNAMNVALVQALQNMQQAGTQRHQSAFGSIAGALAPLAAVPAMQQQAMQDQQLQALKMKVSLYDALVGLKKTEKGDEPKTFTEAILRRMAAGKPYDDLVEAQQKTQKPASITEPVLLKQAFKEKFGRDPSAGELNELWQSQKKDVMSSGAAARAEATLPAQEQLAQFKENLKPKKTLPTESYSEYAKMVTGVGDLDSVIKDFDTNKVGKSDVLVSTLTGGMISNDTLRRYATFYNDVAQARFKSRVTQAEMERLHQELPQPKSYLASPQKFIESLKVARQHAVQGLSKKVEYESQGYDVPADIVRDVGNLAARQSVTDTKRNAAIETLMQKHGWSKEKAQTIYDQLQKTP